MKLVSLMMFGSVVLAGCGAFGTKNNGAKANENDSGLTGNWGQKACTSLDFLGLGHEQETLTFGALGDFDKTTTVYSDAACVTPAVNLSVHGTYAALDNAANMPNARNINFTVDKAVVTPRSADAVKAMNTAAYCGVSSWQLGSTVEVTGKPCLGKTFNNGDVTFDVYQLSNNLNTLELGRGSLWTDKTDAASRPTALDDQAPFDRR